MFHINLSLLTALAVFFHLGASVARTILKDNTDRAKIDKIDSGVSQVLGVVSAIAPAVPTTTPKTLSQVASDLAGVAQALAAATAPVPNGGASNAGA